MDSTTRVLAAVLLLAGVSTASTPTRFAPAVSQDLPLTYANGVEVSPPGLPLSEAQVAEAPTLGNPGLVEAGSKYTLVMVDYDVDVSGTQTSVLQWYQPDYALDSSGNNLVVTNTSATNASYISPQPNQGSPHTYVAILYQQPSDYELPSCLDTQLSVRGGLDLRDFTNAAGLGQAVAADWFQVQNPIPATTTYPITSTSVLSYDCSRTAH